MDALQSPTFQDFLGEWLSNFITHMASLCVVWLVAFIFDIAMLTATVCQIAIVTVFVSFLITLWNWLVDGLSDPLDVYPTELGPTGLSDDHEHYHSPRG